MKSLFGNLSPCCLAANEFCKLFKTGRGWFFFSVLYYFIPQVDSSSFFPTELQASSQMAGNGITWSTRGLSWCNRDQTLIRLLLMKCLSGFKNNWVWHCAWHSAEEMKEKNCLYVNGHEPEAELAPLLQVTWLVFNPYRKSRAGIVLWLLQIRKLRLKEVRQCDNYRLVLQLKRNF